MTEFSDGGGWSPVSDTFACGWDHPPYQIVQIRTLDPATGRDSAVLMTNDVAGETVDGLAWSPSGRWLVVPSAWRVSFVDAQSGKVVGTVDLQEVDIVDWGS